MNPLGNRGSAPTWPRRLIRYGLAAALIIALVTHTHATTRTPIPTFTPRSLPDLVVESARITIPGFTGRCLSGGSVSLSLEICIANRGTAAGSFNLTVNGAHFARVDGIDTSETVCVFGRYTYPQDTTIFLDDENEIEESDETNNETTRFVPIPSRPPSCTATPTATPTPMPTEPPRPCPGDCNGDRKVSVDELIRGVNIALDRATLSSCPGYEQSCTGICLPFIVEAVNNALHGCR